MFKNLRFILCLGFLSITSMAYSGEADFITYDWLINCAKNTSYTDHIPHFRRLFKTMKVRGLLECGCGYSTKYFMDNCDKVISIEFMNPGTDDFWFKECLKLYKGCKNWVPLLYNADHKDESFNKACGYACSVHKDYSLIDSRYIDSMDRYFKNQIKIAHREGKDIDVAFVDAGVYTRGDMVKVLLANKVPVVMAHDTACDPGEDASEGIYGWFIVKTPTDYVKIHIPFGQGTTFWINKGLPKVIKSISAYRDMVVKAHPSFNELNEIVDR